MSATINNALKQLGLSTAHAYLSKGEGSQSVIRSLATKMDVDSVAVRCLLQNQVEKLSAFKAPALQKMINYLQDAAAKPGTQAKGNGPLVMRYASIAQNALAMAGEQQQARHDNAGEVNDMLQLTHQEVALDHMRSAAVHYEAAQMSKFAGKPALTSHFHAERRKDLDKAGDNLRLAAGMAQTPMAKDSAKMALAEAASTGIRLRKK